MVYIGIALLLFANLAAAAEKLPPALQDEAVVPVLGSQTPLDEEFIDETGRTVSLASYFDGKRPVVFVFNYYGCPMLCGVLLNGARDGFEAMDWRPGEHYKVVTISIDPREGADLAMAKKESILASIQDEGLRQAAEGHWHFLVGKDGSEARVAGLLGFDYKWVPEEGQYAHGAALFIASPSGRLSRVLQGLSFQGRDLKLALLEAGEGKVGTFAEKLMRLCYIYDPKDNKYALLASRLVTFGGAVSVVAILLGYLVLFLRNRRKGNACSLSS
jgi:protein SCO1